MPHSTPTHPSTWLLDLKLRFNLNLKRATILYVVSSTGCLKKCKPIFMDIFHRDQDKSSNYQKSQAFVFGWTFVLHFFPVHIEAEELQRWHATHFKWVRMILKYHNIIFDLSARKFLLKINFKYWMCIKDDVVSW